MKKFIAVVALLGLIFVLTACSGSNGPSKAWADEETLTYRISDTDTKETLGEMTVTTVRNPSDKSLNGRDYSSADGRTVIVIKTADKEIRTVMLMNMYNVLAAEKTYTDLKDENNSYVLKARHDGKYYCYSYNDGEEKRINVGRSNYTDSEFLYHYIRCYPISSPPSSIKIGDPASGKAISLSASMYGTDNVLVPFPSGSKAIDCTQIAISLSDAPQGKAILVAFTPDSSDYHVSGLSISKSKKLPVKIVENDVTYTLTSVLVA